MKPRSLVIGIYGHPAFYPPTLNGVNLLASRYEKVYLVFRNIEAYEWKFPDNVELLPCGKKYPIRQLERQSFAKKLWAVLSFAWLLLKTIWKSHPNLLLVYDPLIWLPLSLIKPFFPKGLKIWYHNHDVADPLYVKKYSLFGIAVMAEQRHFASIDYFSLPSLDRKKFFPMDKFKGRFGFLPNYPSETLFKQIGDIQKAMDGPLVLLFQGSISPQHGFEEIIPILGKLIFGRPLHMELVGFIQPVYKGELIKLAKTCGTDKYLLIKDPIPYLEVIKNAQHCHIGLAIYCKQDVMNQTIATASNKIYEYAASGLPVLLFDNAYFRHGFEDRKWVVFSDLSETSLFQSIECIVRNYSEMSSASKDDFINELSFERMFEKAELKLI